jgi:hypothetical protein
MFDLLHRLKKMLNTFTQLVAARRQSVETQRTKLRVF